MPYVQAGYSLRKRRRKLVMASAVAAVGLLMGGAVMALLPEGSARRAIAAVMPD